jgi:radical SAM superfamily enzyme YgiQ (UPF0313 family)
MDDYGLVTRSIGMDAFRECPPYGMYLLHAVLNTRGHDATLVDLIAPATDDIGDTAPEEYGLIGIGATSMSWPTALSVIKQIRERDREVPIVLGGIHPTMFDAYVLAGSGADFVIRGEGEKALVALADALERDGDVSRVPNLTWLGDHGRIVRNPAGLKMTSDELVDCPIPDYSLLPEGVYQGLSIESSRGCAFDCSFCSTSYRKSFRGMVPEIFVDRLEQVLEHQSRSIYDFTHIVDDEFSLNVKRAIAIANEIHGRGIQPKLVYDSRATDLLYDGYVETMRDLTHQFLVGAECGYDEGLKKIGKGTTTDILRRSAAKLAEFGIAERADYSFILGLPWESAREVRRTAEFALSLHEHYGVRLLLQWYCQIPGSRLWEEFREQGVVTEAMYDEFGFFRNLYLFRSAVKLSNEEIDELSRLIELSADIAKVHHGGRTMVEYSHPEPLRLYFPKLPPVEDGLANLRELSLVGRRHLEPRRQEELVSASAVPDIDPLAGRPRRHFIQD